jgi:hypothetical protein
MATHDKRTIGIIKTLQIGSVAQPSTPKKKSKLTIYTQNNLLPSGARSGHCIQGSTSASSSVRLHLHSFVRRKIRSVWDLQENPLTGEISAESLPSTANSTILSIYVVKRCFNHLPPLPLTTFVGIKKIPDTHECSRRRSRLFQVNPNAL